MTGPGFERVVDRRVRRLLGVLGEDIRRLREDAGISRAELARASGIDASYLGDIEDGRGRPSLPICVRLAVALGADPAIRLYPNTGPTIRDRHQAAIAESMLATIGRRWMRFAEIAVRRPARGWIDLGLHDPEEATFVASEIESDIRRLEQLLRWSEAKASSLPSWEGWPRLGAPTTVSRLLVVRDTRTNRATAESFRRLIRAAYPADPRDALDSLLGPAPWPGPAMLWAARDPRAPGYRLIARP